ncbi:hypothetical protein QL285_041808 [Trifolium repens]|nr:hypothetical protein QL285_041808 [Trifolium repens]
MSVFSKLDPDIVTFHILPNLDGKTLIMVVFERVLPVPVGLSVSYTEMVKCRIEVTCSWKGDEEDKFFVNFIYLTMKDMNGKPLLERHGAAVVLNAIHNGERRGRST